MISVIVPVYKTEKYLERCVESLRNQTFRDLEILLVDDGSPDRCPEMCDAYAAEDPRIRVIHKENGGVSSARNAGLEAAKGDYIAFADSDDYLEPDMYENMMAAATRFDCDVVLCDCVKEFADRNALYTHPIRPGYYSRKQLEEEYFPHLLIMESLEYPATISNWLLLFRRELAEDIRYLTGVRYSEDLLFGARLLYRAQSFCYLKGQAYYHYRMNPQSATHRFVPDKWGDYQRLHQGILEAFGGCQDFDFSRQIELCLLFFLHNAVGDICGSRLPRDTKKEKILDILRTPTAAKMFQRTNIGKLKIPPKLKLLTAMYKYRLGIGAYIAYCERKCL